MVAMVAKALLALTQPQKGGRAASEQLRPALAVQVALAVQPPVFLPTQMRQAIIVEMPAGIASRVVEVAAAQRPAEPALTPGLVALA